MNYKIVTNGLFTKPSVAPEPKAMEIRSSISGRSNGLQLMDEALPYTPFPIERLERALEGLRQIEPQREMRIVTGPLGAQMFEQAIREQLSSPPVIYGTAGEQPLESYRMDIIDASDWPDSHTVETVVSRPSIEGLTEEEIIAQLDNLSREENV